MQMERLVKNIFVAADLLITFLWYFFLVKSGQFRYVDVLFFGTLISFESSTYVFALLITFTFHAEAKKIAEKSTLFSVRDLVRKSLAVVKLS